MLLPSPVPAKEDVTVSLVTRHTSHVHTLTNLTSDLCISKTVLVCKLLHTFSTQHLILFALKVRISSALLHCTVEFCIDSEPLMVEVCSLQTALMFSAEWNRMLSPIMARGKHLFQPGLYLVLSWYREIKGACPAAALTTLTLIFYNWSLVFSVQSPPTLLLLASATPRVRGMRTAARITGRSAAARAPAGDCVTRCSYRLAYCHNRVFIVKAKH